jgi:hypothetical protein
MVDIIALYGTRLGKHSRHYIEKFLFIIAEPCMDHRDWRQRDQTRQEVALIPLERMKGALAGARATSTGDDTNKRFRIRRSMFHAVPLAVT